MRSGQKIIAGNWKMNPETQAEAKKLFTKLKKVVQKRKATVVICPPSIHLPALSAERLPKNVFLGAQDCFWENAGSFTGEVSPSQISDRKARYVIIGHSERRALGESDEIVSKKIKAALKEGLTVILCVGESERDSDGVYLEFLKAQLKNSLAEVSPQKILGLVIAYEPVWAIGKKDDEAITGHMLHETVVFVRRFLTHSYGKKKGFSVPILYGGSVSPQNAEEIMNEGNVDGLLVGRQSRDVSGFSEILDKVDSL